MRIGHVVDFAYYVDGGRTIPTRAQLGELFCDDPSFRPPPPAPRTQMDELHEEQDTEEMNTIEPIPGNVFVRRQPKWLFITQLPRLNT
ncbi:hypothetical protein F443_08125 [Phytophthora nicotianae P1569]|uniref:Uncharacterized protein n=1 Tax=Phytophthora nicotianae P1569 TaxID=1317065 RepID=V9F891_PHYNI|nr:hypothetical protein F443_08125 [Phytophthora nicotianae P1569]